MARVFISYRRADGQYAVGWIEERLRQIYQDAAVTMAFRDSDLRLGEDFPDRLAREVKQCDVLIAVIGRQWRGDDEGEPARILDPADWVGREITSALADSDKLVIPVLLSGVEPVRASDLSKEHSAFADLHALRFDVRDDLELLVEQVGDHLTALDTARNHLTGLDHPLDDVRWRPPLDVVWNAVLAAAAGATISWILKGTTGTSNLSWKVFTATQVAFWSGGFVIGRAYIKGPLAGVFDVRWKAVARAGAIGLVLIAVAVTSYAPGQSDQVGVTLIELVAAVTLLSPWILALMGSGWSPTKETAIRPRAITLLKKRHALRAATAVAVIGLCLMVASNATLLDLGPDFATAFAVVGFGVLMSLAVVASVEYSHSRLRQDSELLRLETVDLGGTAQGHIEPALISGRDDLWPRSALLSAGPTLVAIVTAIVVWNLPPALGPLVGKVVS